jgi:hypothetical protein
MRKLIESTIVSADGVIADPPLWAMEYRDKEVDADALEVGAKPLGTGVVVLSYQPIYGER